jgi:hypothetical protein
LWNTVIAVSIAAATIGPFAISGSLSGSATGGNNLSIQVKVDLDKALSELASVLGFRSIQGPGSGTSGPNYYSDCQKNATGDVKQFLTLHRCKQFATATRTISKEGTTAQVAFSWVEMSTSTLASEYKAKVDAPKTGNPPGVSLAFDGLCYASGQQGATVWTVWVRSTRNAKVDGEILQVAARTKLTPSYLGQHCIN